MGVFEWVGKKWANVLLSLSSVPEEVHLHLIYFLGSCEVGMFNLIW